MHKDSTSYPWRKGRRDRNDLFFIVFLTKLTSVLLKPVCVVRLQGLEKKILIESGETPAIVYEMKKQVDYFREKLEVCRGLLYCSLLQHQHIISFYCF